MMGYDKIGCPSDIILLNAFGVGKNRAKRSFYQRAVIKGLDFIFLMVSNVE